MSKTEIFIPNAQIEWGPYDSHNRRRPSRIWNLDRPNDAPIVVTYRMGVQIKKILGDESPFPTYAHVILIDDISCNFIDHEQDVCELLKRIDIPSLNRTFCVLPGIKDVVFNCPATIVFWDDGTKTVVKCMEGDIFNPEHGFAMAVLKKLYSTEDKPNGYRKLVKKWVNHGVSKIPEQDMWRIGEEYHENMNYIGTETIFFKNVSDLARQVEDMKKRFAEKFKK